MVFIIGWISSLLYAEFYKYTDSNGVVRYTDNLGDVPIEQREKVHSYIEIQFIEKPESQTEKDNTKKVQDVKGLDDWSKKIKKQRADLDEEYKSLTKEKSQLLVEKDKLTTPELKLKYNQKVKQLNDRIKNYQEKIARFQQSLTQFNDTVKNVANDNSVKSKSVD